MGDAIAELLDDLEDENADLDRVLDAVEVGDWERPTPAARWTIADQVRHLTASDAAGVLAATDPERFAAQAPALLRAITTERPGDDDPSATNADPGEQWRRSRDALRDALRALPVDARLPWFGPPMSLRSFITARLMETWAHGRDVAVALAPAGRVTVPEPTDRLRHICHLGYATRAWSFTVRGLEAPTEPVRVSLTLPSGAVWSAGDGSAAITGDALDFCLVVTQRSNVAATELVVTGAVAQEWMQVAQCFAGRPSLPPRGA